MQVWNVLHTARWKCRTQKILKNSLSGHHRTTLSGYIFATKARVDNWKKTYKQQCLPHMSSQCGELAAEICSRVWGTQANFNGFCILAALLLGWTEGATYIWQGGHHVGIGPHSSLCLYLSLSSVIWLCWFGNSKGIQPCKPIPCSRHSAFGGLDLAHPGVAMKQSVWMCVLFNFFVGMFLSISAYGVGYFI